MTGLKKLLWWKAASGGAVTPLVEATASGNPATFETDIAKKIKRLEIPFTGSGVTGISIVRCGKNLFNFGAVTQGKYINNSGEEKDTPSGYNWCITDYIKVGGCESISYKGIGSTGAAPYSAWYTADKTLLSTFKQSGSLSDPNVGATVTVPDNAVYVRFSILDESTLHGNFNNFIVAVGDTIGDYEAYTADTHTISFPAADSGTFEAVTGVLTTGGGTVQLEPVVIWTLIGINNVVTDTNGVNTVTYLKIS